MKKILSMMMVFVAFAMLLTGCGGPKMPKDTLAAVYVDIPQALENGIDFIEAAIKKLPKGDSKVIGDKLKEFLDDHKDDFRDIDPKWAVFMVCGDKKNEPRPAFVVKADFGAEISAIGDKSVQKFISEKATKYSKKINSSSVYVEDEFMMTVVDDKYLIGVVYEKPYRYSYRGNSSDAHAEDVSDERGEELMSKLISLYRDNEGETSDDFDDLDDLDGDAIARLQVASLGTLVDLFDVRDMVVDFGKKCEDEDLIEDLLDMGQLTFDVYLSDDIVGYRFELDAGSEDFAKAIEGLFKVVVFLDRIGTDLCIAMPELLGNDIERGIGSGVKQELRYTPLSGLSFSEIAKVIGRVAKHYRYDIDRGGSEVAVECVVETDKMIDAIVPMIEDIFSKVCSH